MGVCMDMNWRRWNGTSSVVGWPQGASGQGWAYQRIAALAGKLAAAGYTTVRMPPSCRGGAGVYSDGYDKFDDYNLDGTAFGNAEMLRQAVGAIHAAGMQAYGDLVLHQYGGGTAEGVYATKRFPKAAPCFVGAPPRVAVDPVPDQTGNFAFGDMASYVNSKPGGYMYFGALAAAKWLTQTAGFDGFRIDDVKGTYADVVRGIIDELGGRYCVGEYFDGNPSAISNYVNQIMGRKISVLDFAFKFNVGSLCNNGGWMGQLADVGWCCRDAATAMTFVESADTDNSPGEQIVWNKMLGYAVMLSFPGYPCVYYRDWASDENCYGLGPLIDNLVWIHEHLAQGAFVPRLDTNPHVFAHERLGYGAAPGCVAFFNVDSVSHTVTVQTDRGPNARLHEYTGNGGYNSDRWTDGNGRLTVTVPPNRDGMGYLVYAPWVEGSKTPTQLRTTQVFEGAIDLGTAAKNGTVTVGAIHAAAGHAIKAALTADLPNAGDLVVSIIGPDGQPMTGTPTQAGRYVLQLVGSGLPTAGQAYELSVDYLGSAV